MFGGESIVIAGEGERAQNVRYFDFGLEHAATTRRPHIHGYIELKEKIPFKHMRNIIPEVLKLIDNCDPMECYEVLAADGPSSGGGVSLPVREDVDCKYLMAFEHDTRSRAFEDIHSAILNIEHQEGQQQQQVLAIGDIQETALRRRRRSHRIA